MEALTPNGIPRVPPLPYPVDEEDTEERVTYAPKAGVKCHECGHTFDAVKCPSCGAVDHSHPLVRFGELVDSRTIPGEVRP